VSQRKKVQTRKLKVYGGYIFGGVFGSRGSRCVIAAHSLKEVSAIPVIIHYNISYYYLRGYWCETGNDIELKTALAKPHTIFYVQDSDVYQTNRVYREMPSDNLPC